MSILHQQGQERLCRLLPYGARGWSSPPLGALSVWAWACLDGAGGICPPASRCASSSATASACPTQGIRIRLKDVALNSHQLWGCQGCRGRAGNTATALIKYKNLPNIINKIKKKKFKKSYLTLLFVRWPVTSSPTLGLSGAGTDTAERDPPS